MTDFLEFYSGLLEGLINAYRILIAIKEGKKTVKLFNTERKRDNDE